MRVLCITAVQAAVWEHIARSSHPGTASGLMMVERCQESERLREKCNQVMTELIRKFRVHLITIRLEWK